MLASSQPTFHFPISKSSTLVENDCFHDFITQGTENFTKMQEAINFSLDCYSENCLFGHGFFSEDHPLQHVHGDASALRPKAGSLESRAFKCKASAWEWRPQAEAPGTRTAKCWKECGQSRDPLVQWGSLGTGLPGFLEASNSPGGAGVSCWV